MDLSRRQFLTGLGILAGGIAAGCTKQLDPTAPPTPTTAAPATTPPTTAAPTPTTAPPAPTTTSPPATTTAPPTTTTTTAPAPAAPTMDLVTAGAEYFERDGTPFFVVGHCANPDTLVDAAYCDRYFGYAADHGESVIRMLFGSSKNFPNIETAPGVIEPGFAPYFDQVLHIAASHNVYVMPGIWSWWSDHYNSPGFFSAASTEPQHQVLGYLAAHWGQDPTIFAWEIYNELWLPNVPWVADTANYLRSTGAHQMIGASASGPDAVGRAEGLDFASFHAYGVPGLAYGEGTGQAALDQRALNVPGLVATARANCPGLPMLDSEVPGLPLNFLSKLIANATLTSIPNSAFEASFYDVGVAHLNAATAGSLSWGSSLMPNFFDLSPRCYDLQVELRTLADHRLSS